MNATEKLRRLLDERGVEWEKPPGILEPIKTVWRSGPWEYEAIETRDGDLGVYAAHCDWITPEQAVEATLGRGECRDTGEYVSAFECSACGEVYEMYRDPDYCPGCGRKVVK